jgi:hypothetical protein
MIPIPPDHSTDVNNFQYIAANRQEVCKVLVPTLEGGNEDFRDFAVFLRKPKTLFPEEPEIMSV